MVTATCPRCGTVLDEGTAFCHECGLELSPPAPPILQGGAPPYAPMPHWGMFPGPGMEPPVRPLGHQRTLLGMSGIIMLFTASVVLIIGLIFLTVYSYGWNENYDDWDNGSGRVIHWDYILAGGFMMAAFTMGLVGAICALRATRPALALVGAVLVLVAGVIAHLGDIDWAFTFLPLLGGLGLVLLLLGRPAFNAPVRVPKGGMVPPPKDNYGWERWAP